MRQRLDPLWSGQPLRRFPTCIISVSGIARLASTQLAPVQIRHDAPYMSSIMISRWKPDRSLMRTCGTCKLEKPDTDYYIRNKAKGTLQGNCKVCHKAYRDKHYADNRQHYKDRSAAWRTKEKKKFFTWLDTQSCTDCGISDYRVLEFDHLRDKEFGITDRIGAMTLEALQAEIDKCEIVCANCHRLRTAERGNYYSYM